MSSLLTISEKLKKLASTSELITKLVSDVDHYNSLSIAEKEKVTIKKIANMIQHGTANFGFYSKLYEKHQVDYTQINTLKDLEKLPFVTKNDLREQYPFGFLASSREELCRYAESTGTTGKPTSSFFSRESWIENNLRVAYRMQSIVNKSDIAVIAAPYALAIPAQDMERILELIGCTIIACGILNEVCPMDRLINILKSVKPSVLICSGSRSLLIAEMSKKIGLDPKKDFGIKKIINVAESLHTGKKAKINEVWGAKVYNAYGTTETCALALSCTHGNTHLFDDMYYFEVIDSETNKVLPHGKTGELVVTSLSNQAMPLIRYRTQDKVCIMDSECECGNKSPIIKHYGRLGDNLTIGDKTSTEEDNFSISFLELEEIVLSSEGHDKFYQFSNTDDNLQITIDLLEGYSIQNVKNRILNKFPERIRDRIEVKSYSHEERENRINRSMKSNKPFGSFCFNKN